MPEVFAHDGPAQKVNAGEEAPGAPETAAMEIVAAIKTASETAAGTSAVAETAKTDPFKVESIGSDEITPELLKEISEYFRWIFITDFPEYLVCQSCGVTNPADEVFGLEKGMHVPLSVADNLREFPDCGQCGEKMEFLHDPDRTLRKIEKKLQKDALFTSIRSAKDNALEGYTFGYKTTLRQAFENEWGYQFGYTKNPAERRKRDFNRFSGLVCPILDIEMSRQLGRQVHTDGQSDVYCWNCTVIGPNLRGKRVLPLMLKSFCDSLPVDSIASLPVIGEVMAGSRWCNILKSANQRPIEGILDSKYVILAGSLANNAERFTVVTE